MQEIMEPGAQLLNRLVSASRRPEPTVVYNQDSDDAFDRIQTQLEAIQELRVWRAIRHMTPEPEGCPPRPRLIRHVLSADEEEHAQSCGHCQAVLRSTKLSKLTIWFERIERRWRLFKETKPSFCIRAVQATLLVVLIAALLTVGSYPQRVSTRQMLNIMKADQADQLNTLARDRDQLVKEVAQLNRSISMLNTLSEQSQAEQLKLAHRLRLATKELNILRSDNQELLKAINQRRSSTMAHLGGVPVLQTSQLSRAKTLGPSTGK